MRAPPIYLFTLCALAIGGQAGAAEPVVQVTVLPTATSGPITDRAAWQRALDARVNESVRKLGRAPRAPGPLTTAEAICRDAECMGRIAESADVGIVLGVKITADRGSPPSYRLVLTRYDRDRPGAVRQEEAECSVCTQDETADRLERMVVAMLPSLTVHAPIATAVEPVAVAVAPEPKPSHAKLYALIGATAAIGLGGIAMLGAGAQGIAIDGSYVTSPVPPAMEARDVYDSKPAGIGLVAAGSVCVIGAAVALVFEVRALKRSRR